MKSWGIEQVLKTLRVNLMLRTLLLKPNFVPLCICHEVRRPLRICHTPHLPRLPHSAAKGTVNTLPPTTATGRVLGTVPVCEVLEIHLHVGSQIFVRHHVGPILLSESCAHRFGGSVPVRWRYFLCPGNMLPLTLLLADGLRVGELQRLLL